MAPGARRVDVMTTQYAKRRITDQAAGLAVLTMTSAFAVGDLIGGIVNGLRQLSDAAGRPRAVEGEIQLERISPLAVSDASGLTKPSDRRPVPSDGGWVGAEHVASTVA